MPKPSKKFLWISPLPAQGHLASKAQEREQLTSVLDTYRFNWRVWAVAAAGVFADSYAFFATLVILPVLAYVYWPNDNDGDHDVTISGVALAGALFGQLLVGILSDRLGRMAGFALALALVIVGTFCAAQASSGVFYLDGTGRSSMSFYGWFLAWRFVLGLGTGPGAPLSAIIGAEWSSVRSRARMIAAVYLMQPVGQAVAYLIGLVALVALDRQYDLRDIFDQPTAAPIADRLWRWVIGVGAIPALIAIALRFTLPETGRFVLEIQEDGDRAAMEAEAHYGLPIKTEKNMMTDDVTECGIDDMISEVPRETTITGDVYENTPFSAHDLHNYFIREGNWRYLAATTLCWFFTEFAYSGLQINNARYLTKLWASEDPQGPSSIPSWLSNPAQIDLFGNPTTTLYSALMDNIRNLLLTVSIASICGSIALIKMINYLPRRRILIWSFLGTGAVLAGTGAGFLRSFRTGTNGITLIFYILGQFLFNMGPNPLLYMITAEIFPTRYRSTCYGISAAAGKLASILVVASMPYFKFGNTDVRDLNSNDFGWVLIILGCSVAFAAAPAWLWLPEVQSPRRAETGLALPSKTLEELGEGRVRAEAEGDHVGFRRRSFSAPWKRRGWNE